MLAAFENTAQACRAHRCSRTFAERLHRLNELPLSRAALSSIKCQISAIRSAVSASILTSSLRCAESGKFRRPPPLCLLSKEVLKVRSFPPNRAISRRKVPRPRQIYSSGLSRTRSLERRILPPNNPNFLWGSTSSAVSWIFLVQTALFDDARPDLENISVNATELFAEKLH
jgi:hypothetical protein